MATSSSLSVLVQETRPPADPTPTKRGEIGFRESLHAIAPEGTTGRDSVGSLPSRHPVDTDPPRSSTVSGVASPTSSVAPGSSPLCALFKPKKFHKSGIHSSTIILLAFQSGLLLTTVASWVLLVKLVIHSSTVSLVIHVVFSLLSMFQIIFLERTTYKLRAERYAALHPGEVMPSALFHPDRTPSRLALTPWNRPPLPTYATVLMDSGIGTGDVEDNQIAIPPPPAYGITRGSRLILAGFISEELRNESRRVRVERGERLSDMTELSAGRPISLFSQDSLEARCEVTRARILEETLSRLETAEVPTSRT